MRIIFVPQYPTPMRYQSWWGWKFEEQFEKYGFEVVRLGKNSRRHNTIKAKEMFSPINAAIEYELIQIEEYMNLKIDYDNDIVFMADISFPGLFGNALFHKAPKRVFGFCHATSMNRLDYFEENRTRKFLAEQATAFSCKHVFVGSYYHQHKLHEWPNVKVTYLPYPPFPSADKVKWQDKEHDIISVARPTAQKVDVGLELFVEDCLRTTVKRKEFVDWHSYYEFISKSKVMLITAQEETFGYQVVDAVKNGCIPLAPNRCSYTELLPPEFIYDNRNELVSKLDYIINSKREIPKVPELLCHGKMKEFYRNIIKIMKGDEDYPF